MEQQNGHDSSFYQKSDPATPDATIVTFPVVAFVRYIVARTGELFAREIGARGYIVVSVLFVLILLTVAYFWGNPIHGMVGPD